jgi:tetratricopeptide (TPR) repeat protein
MNVELPRARVIFLDAVENHEPDRWPQYLDAACGEDPSLRRRVEVLLQAHARSAGLLDQLRKDPAPTVGLMAPAEGVGSSIGPYNLREQIGEDRKRAVATAFNEGHTLLEPPNEDPVRALALLRRVVAGDPTKELTWKYLGAAECRNGHWDAAIKASEKCIELRGDGGWAYQWLVLALSHARRGEMVKAREWFAKARPKLGGDMHDTPRWLIDESRSLLGTDPSQDEAKSKRGPGSARPPG